MEKNSKVLIVGHDDIMERSLFRHFREGGYNKIFSVSAAALETTVQPSVYQFFQEERPEYVFLGSTRSGGIEANRLNSGEFIYHNLVSQSNIIYAAQKFGTKKLLFYGSSCIYPKECPQPITENSLLTGPLEPTSEAYALAKIAGLKLCQSYKKQFGFNAITIVPATVYGPGNDFDLTTGHVIGALIKKFYEAIRHNEKEVNVWGSGTPRREFLFVNDFVDASLFLMDKYDGDGIINAGTGKDVSVKELALKLADLSGFKGSIKFNTSKPDGAPQKLLDNSRISEMGWKPKVTLDEGLKKTWNWFCQEQKERTRVINTE